MFSVRDHTRRGAFVAEALLYDHLIIPVVPTDADLEQEAAQCGETIDAKQAAKVEWQRWIDARWDPGRQKRLTDILICSGGGGVDLVPWTFARQSEWRTVMNNGFANARRDGYFGTRTVLQRFAPIMAKSIVAVTQYHSLRELGAEEGIRRRNPQD